VEILVVEDDIDAAAMYRAALESRGHKVITAFDGRDCLKIYQDALVRIKASVGKIPSTAPFDAVVLDYKLPLIDGLQVAREILSSNPNQRIIFASAYTRETLVNSVRDLKKVVELLQKPFDPEVLVKLVEDPLVAGKLKDLNAQAAMSTSDPGPKIDSLLRKLESIQKTSAD
jgi:CheY-like chemotaxis protein